MTAMTIAGLILVAALAVCGAGVVRGQGAAQLAALELAGVTSAALTLVMGGIFNQSFYVSAAMLLAVLAFPTAKVLAQFLEDQINADGR